MFNWFKKSSKESIVNFVEIDSNEKAAGLFAAGKLGRIYLKPLEFGGMDMPMNQLYVTNEAVKQKKKIDFKIEQFLIAEKKIGYTTEPEYKGNSFIPSKIKITVTGEVQMKESIVIW